MDIFFKILADHSRRRLLHVLTLGRFSVGELVDVLRVPQSLVSHHLRVLLQGGLVQSDRHGRTVVYRLSENNPLPPRREILDLFLRWTETQPEYCADRSSGVRILNLRREKSLAFFARHAAGWDTLALTGVNLEASRDFIRRSLAGLNCTLVADLGAGTGQLIPWLLDWAERVIGVDNSREMLERARVKIADPRVEFRLGDLEHLPLPDSSVQAAVMHFVLHHCADPATVFPEIRRVLPAGGHFVLMDFHRHAEESFRSARGDIWLGFDEHEIGHIAARNGFGVELAETIPTPRAGVSSFALSLINSK